MGTASGIDPPEEWTMQPADEHAAASLDDRQGGAAGRSLLREPEGAVADPLAGLQQEAVPQGGARQPVGSRSEFHAAIRSAFAEAARVGCRELWLCDTDFADWPLGERAVIASLTEWAASHRRLTLLANHFDDVVRRHARWVEWRRSWSHLVHCRTNTDLESDKMPSLLLASGLVSVRLIDPAHHRGVVSQEAADGLRCREIVDAVLQRSEEAFSATTTGL
ncbi:hypothetical protein BH11PSE9_BH11PSE9_33940 [soil metagenome]